MNRRITILVALLLCPLTLSALRTQPRSPAAATYTVRSNGDVVQLEDATHRIVVSIVPSVGNTAYAMTVNGTNILRSPYPSLEAFKSGF